MQARIEIVALPSSEVGLQTSSKLCARFFFVKSMPMCTFKQLKIRCSGKAISRAKLHAGGAALVLLA